MKTIITFFTPLPATLLRWGTHPVPDCGVFAPKSFALHRITSSLWTGRCSAWYLADGTLEDAEWIRMDGQVRNIPRFKAMWRELERLGKVWK
jgi:hypothetical protein